MNYSMFDEIDYFTNFKGNQGMSDDDTNLGNFSFPNSNDNNKLSLYNPYEGYIKGNLFKNLYQGYKNYQAPRIKVGSEREEALLNVGQISFAAHELNLFLDNYPNNEEALNLYNKYRRMEDDLVKNYERRYGPLNVSSPDMKTIPFKWESDKWPWEM